MRCARLAIFGALILSGEVGAQESAGIAGVVKDTSGAVLPGVTIEASSPALIERLRSVTTDAEGQFKVVDLRPGTYALTATLTGFNTFKREGIVLTSGFTATISINMQVGSLEETVTVTGGSPLVDTQNTVQQKVLSSELLEAVPSASKTIVSLVAMTPGLVGQASVGGSAGAYEGMSQSGASYHGKSGTVKTEFDGLRINNMEGVGSPGVLIAPAAVEETTVETGGVTAESISSSVVWNMIPKEGGNTFRTIADGIFMSSHLEANNLNDDLRGRGLTTANKVLKTYDVDASLGGPVLKDKAWFFALFRAAATDTQIAGLYYNKTHGTAFYTPDLSRPGGESQYLRSGGIRLTSQLSPKDKVAVYFDLQNNCVCSFPGASGGTALAAEAILKMPFWPQYLLEGKWSSPRTNKLLMEAGVTAAISPWPTYPQPGIGNSISIIELSGNLRYNSAGFLYGNPHDSTRYSEKFAASYVTGSHAFKAGISVEQGVHNIADSTFSNVNYSFLNRKPVSITEFADPWEEEERIKADLGLFAQDQWTIKRATVNYGVRFDYFNAYVPAESEPAGEFVPARNFAALYAVPSWKDIDPRLGLAYDLFANGRTAVKFAVGRYVVADNATIAKNVNPMVTSVNSASRTWTLSATELAQMNQTGQIPTPNCNLQNPAANGECGAINNSNFGLNNPNATQYSTSITQGFEVRPYTWDISAEIQQEIRTGISLTGGYYRNWYGNFTATQNVAVTPSDYSPYCITAPSDPRLPGAGGYPVCGLYDVSPAKFGKIQNLVTSASQFGNQSLVNDFFSAAINTRLSGGVRVGGGVDTGRSVSDSCFVVSSPQQQLYCHVVTPFSAQTQVKLFGSYPLPKDFALSAAYQNVSGPAVLANYVATNNQIAPSLGRNLAAGVNGTATVPLIAPQTLFEDRITQLDLRLSKIFTLSPLGSRGKLRLNLDAYNVLNSSSILGVNNTFGPLWRQPLTPGAAGSSVLVPRLIEIGGQLSF